MMNQASICYVYDLIQSASWIRGGEAVPLR